MANIDATWSGLDGSGVIVTVADTGLDNGVNNSNMHPDFGTTSPASFRSHRRLPPAPRSA